MSTPWRPHVTVAAIAEEDGRYLVVEEEVSGKLVINQPAGHLDEGETLEDAVRRETLEETGCTFEPEHLIGIYLWRSAGGKTFLRVAFCGRCTDHDPERPLDEGIRRALWLNRSELMGDGYELRSPMVLRCIDDYAAGQRLPLGTFTSLAFETDDDPDP